MTESEEVTSRKAVPHLYGPYGSAALAHGKQLRSYGANAAWFHGFDGAAFDACAAHGLAACVEFKTFRADFDLHPELVPIGIDGRAIRYGRLVQGVCLSQTDFLAETEENLLIGLGSFAPTGIWLDYLTYAGWFETPDPDLQESCFCPDCVQSFCDATGVDAERPEQILTHHGEEWTRHKCQRVAGFALHYAELIRAALPNCTVGAYMCPWTPQEYDGALSRIFAQDYDLLAPAIDIFTPLIYAQKSGRSAQWGRAFLESAPHFVPAERKVQLILDALDFPHSLLAAAHADRASWGIQIFGGAKIFEREESASLFRDVMERMQ
jgi:hypothetical protein